MVAVAVGVRVGSEVLGSGVAVLAGSSEGAAATLRAGSGAEQATLRINRIDPTMPDAVRVASSVRFNAAILLGATRLVPCETGSTFLAVQRSSRYVAVARTSEASSAPKTSSRRSIRRRSGPPKGPRLRISIGCSGTRPTSAK